MLFYEQSAHAIHEAAAAQRPTGWKGKSWEIRARRAVRGQRGGGGKVKDITLALL